MLIDEWQRLPESFNRVRRAVDAGAAAGSFLLTGSASPTERPSGAATGHAAPVDAGIRGSDRHDDLLREDHAATGGQGQKPSRATTQPFRDVLERLWILDPVPAWLPTRSRLARLAAPPKHHLADPGLAARLLGVDAQALLHARPAGPPIARQGTLLGALFESLVTLSVRVYAQAAEAHTAHLRMTKWLTRSSKSFNASPTLLALLAP